MKIIYLFIFIDMSLINILFWLYITAIDPFKVTFINRFFLIYFFTTIESKLIYELRQYLINLKIL